MDLVSFTPLKHMLGYSKCGRCHKGHPLPYGANCALALAKEHADKSRDIPAWGVKGPVVPTQLGPSALNEPPAVDNAAPVLTENHIKPQDRVPQQKTTSLITTMTTITTGAPIECSLVVLSTRLGQQDEQSARDRCQIDMLLQQFSDTTSQFAHISKVLDCLLTGIPLWPHWQMPQQHQVPVQGMALSLPGQHHLSHKKALPPARSIPLPVVSMPIGRQPHTATQRFGRIKQVLPRHRSITAP